MKRLYSLITISLLLGTLLAGVYGQAVKAQNPISDDEVNAVAKGLYCPVCENTPLDVCPTQACKDWRELIRVQLGDGWSQKQIEDYFVANYGPRVLAEPQTKGFTVLVWILPLVALAAGGVVLWRFLRQWQAHHLAVNPVVGGAATAVPDIDPALVARIEREVDTRF